jgi:replicative DNA helicase
MTAPQRRPALELVPDAKPTDEAKAGIIVDVEAPETWEAETFLAQWEPEHQLVGALMWMTAAQAKPILELVPDTAIWRPTSRWAYQIIRQLVDEGRAPGPVIVLATAKHQPCDEGTVCAYARRPPTPGRHHKLAVYLANAYTQTVSPAAAGDYAREVLEEAYRRGFTQAGIRMQQLGECGAEPEALTTQFITIRDELADLRRRAEAVAKPGWWQP